VLRGDVVESVHRVHVAASDGAGRGDDLVCFLRSAAKPTQAIPLVEAYDDLTDEEIAIACASHQAEPPQLEAVRVLLARAGATVDDLENGPQDNRPDGRLGHNCSGKHAGMLASCRAREWPFENYRLPGHPLQRRIQGLIGRSIAAVDGCGLPTYGMPLSAMAALFARTPERITAAMRARPDLVGGAGIEDTELMRLVPGLMAKRGAEGLLCLIDPGGVGYAFKVEDGNARALLPAAGSVLGLPELVAVELRNSLGETVGEIRAGG
jgi:L-asparaginase II